MITHKSIAVDGYEQEGVELVTDGKYVTIRGTGRNSQLYSVDVDALDTILNYSISLGWERKSTCKED